MGARVVVRSEVAETHSVVEAITLGATGWITKNAPATELMDALWHIGQYGSLVLDADAGNALLNELVEHYHPPQAATAALSLTERELAVLALLIEGKSEGEVAQSLNVSRSTVANHVSSMRAKTGAMNMVQLGILAERLGYVSPDMQAAHGQRPL